MRLSLDEWAGLDDEQVPRSDAPAPAAPPPAPAPVLSEAAEQPLFSAYADAAARAVAALEEEERRERERAARALEAERAAEIARLEEEQAELPHDEEDEDGRINEGGEQTAADAKAAANAKTSAAVVGLFTSGPQRPFSSSSSVRSGDAAVGDKDLEKLLRRRRRSDLQKMSPRMMQMIYKDALIAELGALPAGWGAAIAEVGRSRLSHGTGSMDSLARRDSVDVNGLLKEGAKARWGALGKVLS